jgi:UDPglucose 6-dehydrogenase
VAARLAREGAILTAYDPQVEPPAILVLTEWPEFRELDWPRLATATAHPAVVDTRNLLDPVARAGFQHTGMGLG